MAEGAPISNHQLHDYLGAQSVAHTNPASESYVGSDMAHLHGESYGLLQSQVQASIDPLVRAENGGHRLASETLEMGVGAFNGMLAEDMRTLRTGLREPQKARAVIQASYDQGGGTPPAVTDPDHLNLKEVAEYLEILAERLPDNQERALHRDSLGLLGRLVDRWQDGQRQPGQPEFPNSTSVPLSAPLAGSRNGAPSIDMFLTEQRRHFERITAEKIVHLGQAALNPSVIRQQAAAHVAGHGSSYVAPSPVDSSPNRSGPMDVAAVEAARKMVAGVNVSSGTPRPERAETSRIIDETIKAARGKAVIHLDVPRGVRMAHKYGPETRDNPGFKTFGDGDEAGPNPNEQLPGRMLLPVSDRNLFQDPEGQPITDIVEGWGFTPTEDGSKDEYFDYAYNSKWTYPPPEGYPQYTESSGGRPGGMFILRVRLSREKAESFRQAVLPNPDGNLSPEQRAREGAEKTATVREFAHQVVVQLGTDQDGRKLMKKAWSVGGVGDRGDSNPMRPPYDRLPPQHRPYIIRPRGETGAPYETAERLW